MSIAEKLTQIAENESKVFEAGKAEGKQAEYDAFWDAYQDNGNRTDYQYAFAGLCWDDVTFKPKYDIVTKTGYSGQYMFWNSRINNIAETLEKRGLKFDVSKCGYVHQMFQHSTTKRLPVLDFSNAGELSKEGVYYVFAECRNLETIDKIIVKDTFKYAGAFNNCVSLENLTIEGTIGQSGLNLQWSTRLSRASIESVITHLSKETSGLTVTFSKVAVDKAFETSEGANDGSDFASNTDYWALINGYPDWTFNLV